MELALHNLTKVDMPSKEEEEEEEEEEEVFLINQILFKRFFS